MTHGCSGKDVQKINTDRDHAQRSIRRLHFQKPFIPPRTFHQTFNLTLIFSFYPTRISRSGKRQMTQLIKDLTIPNYNMQRR